MPDRSADIGELLAHPIIAIITPHLVGEVCVVGGIVRDALLGRPHLHDVDLVVEGDAIAVGRTVARELGCGLVAHERFGTCVLELPHHGGHVDLISARSETYPTPGALPVVGPGGLRDDLGRRDFTINAMAVRVTGAEAGALIDPFGGQRDLRNGVIRALRDDAFVEDPSRIVRAARYAGRLGFTISPQSAQAMVHVAGGIDWTSARVARELQRLLDEESPASALAHLVAAGCPGIIDVSVDAIAGIDAAHDAWRRLTPHAPDVARWALRAGVALTPEVRDVVAIPGWGRGVARELADGVALAANCALLHTPSSIDALLGAQPVAMQIGAHAAGAEVVATWWREWRDVRPVIRGSDLARSGVTPGPAIGRALARLRAAVLDGHIEGHDAQLEFAVRAAQDA